MRAPRPIHAFANNAPLGVAHCGAICGAMLARGWLDATDDPSRVTCAACRRMTEPANIDPREGWVLLLCTDCDQQGGEVSPEFFGIGKPCEACGTGTLTTLRDLQRQAKLGRKLVAIGDP